MLSEKTVGFLGAGSMTESLVRGLLAGGVVQPKQLLVTNRANRERLAILHAQYGIQTSDRTEAVVAQADILVIACKPKDVPALLLEAGALTRPGQVLISLAAGIPTDLIVANITPGVSVVRAMPNTSCTVGLSATAICLGEGAGEQALALAQAVLGAVGEVVEVAEPLMDGVTGLSGTGPAYIYLLVEAMVAAGQNVGIPYEIARQLVLQTVLGAAKMLVETGEQPALLRRQVTSPGGTTMAAMQELEQAGFVPAMVRAVEKATARSREMGAQAAQPLLEVK